MTWEAEREATIVLLLNEFKEYVEREYPGFQPDWDEVRSEFELHGVGVSFDRLLCTRNQCEHGENQGEHGENEGEHGENQEHGRGPHLHTETWA